MNALSKDRPIQRQVKQGLQYSRNRRMPEFPPASKQLRNVFAQSCCEATTSPHFNLLLRHEHPEYAGVVEQP
jgi:hypothetical protein